MADSKQMMMRVLRRCGERRPQSHHADAVIWVTPCGAEVELANGSGRMFLQPELDEPVIEAGIRWARMQGARVIRIRR